MELLNLARNIWMSTIMIISVIGNILLIAVITRSGRYYNVTNVYNLNLSASDLLKVLLFVPVYLVYATKQYWPFGIAACRGIYLLFFSWFGVSVLTLMCLSFERYRLVVHPLRQQMTVRTACILVTITWIVSLTVSALSVPFLHLIDGPHGLLCAFKADEGWNLAIITLMTIFAQGIPGAFFIVSYVLIIRKLRRDSVVAPRDQSLAARNRLRRNRRAVKILAVEVIAYIVCLTPFFLFNFEEIVSKNILVMPFTVSSLIIFCSLILHTAVNPTVHFILNGEFRKELVGIWRCATIKRRFNVNTVEHQDSGNST